MSEPEDILILVSNQGRAWKAPVGRAPLNAKFSELGLGKGEYLVGAGILKPDHYLTLGTRAGNIKRTKMEDLSMSEASWAAIIGLRDKKDEVLFATVASNEAEVLFFTAGGKAIRFLAMEVNPQATNLAKGVSGIKLSKDDTLVAGLVIEPEAKAQVVIVSQTGFVKRIALKEFPVQGRAGQGLQTLEIVKGTGKVAAATVATGEAKTTDILSAKGFRHRLPLTSLPIVDRRKRGEKLSDFGVDDVITAVVTL